MSLADTETPRATVRLRVTYVYVHEYDADSRDYEEECGPDPTPREMAALDQRLHVEDPHALSIQSLVDPIVLVQVVPT